MLTISLSIILLLAAVGITILLWGIIVGSSDKSTDDAAQMKAINQWKEKKRRKHE